MAAYSLQTLGDELVGFLLLAGSESLGAGDAQRDCVFMSAPATAEIVEHELNVFLTENKATEFRCSLLQRDDIWEAKIIINAQIEVLLVCAEGDKGNWQIRYRDGRVLAGRCEIIGLKN